jgi:hypothetical protein
MDIFSEMDLYSMIEPFAIEVIVNVGTSDEFVFKAIFDNASKLYADGEVFSNTNPKLTCRTSDIENLTKTSSLSIKGTKRTIRDIQHQNWGISVLELKQ